MSNTHNIINSRQKMSASRNGIHDIWNAYFVSGATWSANDIPLCPTTANSLPASLISYRDAISINNKAIKNGNYSYRIDAFVHFWIDDQKFDGIIEGVWSKPAKILNLLRHFAGVITPDFSTYADFPDPICRYNTYRMRAIGYWLGLNGISVINNVRWGSSNTWNYCFDGIENNSIIAIGSSASNPYLLDNRPLFEEGLLELVEILTPSTIIVYGGSTSPVFETIKSMGVKIVFYPSRMQQAFTRGTHHE